MAESGCGLPPLKNLQAVMDAFAFTRSQLTRRSGLSAPTVARAIEGKARVRASTARKLAKVLGVPQEYLYSDVSLAELRRRGPYPTITAGREYTYPETMRDGERAAERNGNGGEPAADGEGEDESLRVTLERMEARLADIEEAVTELASRPIAEFDVQLTERKGERL